MEIAILALGCFWKPEMEFDNFNGIVKTDIWKPKIMHELSIAGKSILSFFQRMYKPIIAINKFVVNLQTSWTTTIALHLTGL